MKAASNAAAQRLYCAARSQRSACACSAARIAAAIAPAPAAPRLWRHLRDMLRVCAATARGCNAAALVKNDVNDAAAPDGQNVQAKAQHWNACVAGVLDGGA